MRAQQRITFATYEAAKEFAEAVVREIAQNRSNFITLRGQQAYDYQQAVTLLSTAGLSFMDAARLASDNVKMVGSAALVSGSLR